MLPIIRVLRTSLPSTLRVWHRVVSATIAIAICALTTLMWMIVLRLLIFMAQVTSNRDIIAMMTRFEQQSQAALVNFYSKVFLKIMGIKARYFEYIPGTNSLSVSSDQRHSPSHPWKPDVIPELQPTSAQALTRRLSGLHHQSPAQSIKIMLQSNHMSIIDIFLIGACVRTSFMAKSEVKNWPVIGWMSHWAGILFVNRNSTTAKYQSIFKLKKNSARFPSVSFLKLPLRLIPLRA